MAAGLYRRGDYVKWWRGCLIGVCVGVRGVQVKSFLCMQVLPMAGQRALPQELTPNTIF